MKLDWLEFKTYLDSLAIYPQYIELDSEYNLFVVVGPMLISCKLDKNPTDNTNLTDFITNYKAKSNKQITLDTLPFASKILPNGKKLYRRVIGNSLSVSDYETNLDYTIPFTNCKITGVEVIGAVLGDKCSFQILDTAAGTLTTIPNYMLNEFGTGVYLSESFHNFSSPYDADLFVGLQLRLIYTPKDTGSSRAVYFNYILNEVKD